MNKRFLVDKNAPEQVKSLLSQYGTVYETQPLPTLTGATATHPDMQFVQTGKGGALAASELADYYRGLFPDLEITAVHGIRQPYPFDSVLNFAELSDKRIITGFQRENLPPLPRKPEITVRQGYARCSVCILDSNAVLTADKGIASCLEKAGLKAYYLPDDEIELNGYKNGFWGGCSGLIGDNSLFFCGDIEKLGCSAELLKILERENVAPVYPKKIPLTDFGSVLTVF